MVNEVVDGGTYWTCKCSAFAQGNGNHAPQKPYQVKVRPIITGGIAFVGDRIKPNGQLEAGHCLVSAESLFPSQQGADMHYKDVCRKHAAVLLREATMYTLSPDMNSALEVFAERLDS